MLAAACGSTSATPTAITATPTPTAFEPTIPATPIPTLVPTTLVASVGFTGGWGHTAQNPDASYSCVFAYEASGGRVMASMSVAGIDTSWLCSIASPNDMAMTWSRTVADQRPHRVLDATVGEVFREREQPALVPLPAESFEVAYWAKAMVHPDCHVQVRRHFYSVPWRLVGTQLDVRIGERLVSVYHAGELVKTHIRERGELRYTDPDDFPAQKIAFLLRTPQWCRRQAAELGPAVVQLVDELLAEPFPLTRLRQAQAVIRLAEEHGAERLDAACQRALPADASYRTVRTLLINERDRRIDDGDTHVSSAGAYLHGQQVLLEGMQ